MDVHAIVFVVLGLGLALAVVRVARLGEAARQEGMRTEARRLTFDHRARSPGVPVEGLDELPTLRKGRSRRARSIMSGDSSGRELVAFDWFFRTGGGNRSGRHRMTIVAFRRKNEPRTEFQIRPENAIHRIASALGWLDIDFENDAEFSGSYLLRGSDEKAIRALFSRSTRRAFARDPGWQVDAGAEWVGLWRHRRPSPQGLREYIERADRLMCALEEG